MKAGKLRWADLLLLWSDLSLQAKAAACVLVFAFVLSGCGPDKSKMTDAQLGLTAEQSAGRQIYNQRCAQCHFAYSSRGSKGPSLKGLFKRQYLPSGLPANDRFVTQTILHGRGIMPAAGYTLSDDQLRALIAYLHTL
ncbi:MAG TPA: cytochrome c [Candidatus Acidoferrales bacterium]|nr:cytochrome c [Candidatus Acidoferrales bacterium]